MKTNTSRHLLAAATLVVAGTSAAQQAEPPVLVRVEGLPAHVRERIEQEAAKGQTALIQYLHRTQSVHGLRTEYVIKAEQPMNVARKPDPTKIAESDKGAAKK